MANYTCTICGFVYDESVEAVPFADLPESWVCPLCGAGKELFAAEDGAVADPVPQAPVKKGYIKQGTDAFRDAFNRLSYGLFIMTSSDGGVKAGCVANVCFQTTSNPATVAICLNHENYTNQIIKKSGRVCVNVLPETADPKLIGEFGFKSSRDTDKFAGLAYEDVNGSLVLGEACAYLAGKIIGATELSTHTVFSVEVDDAGLISGDTPMTYEYYHRVIKGKAPKNAPTFSG